MVEFGGARVWRGVLHTDVYRFFENEMAYSSISHIPVETVSFALSLRQDDSGEKDPFEGLTEEEREQLADQGKRMGGRGPCKNKSCVEEETQYKIQLVTKVQLSRKLSELQTEFGDIDEEVQEVTITWGALEEQVGLGLVEVVNNKLI